MTKGGQKSYTKDRSMLNYTSFNLLMAANRLANIKYCCKSEVSCIFCLYMELELRSRLKCVRLVSDNRVSVNAGKKEVTGIERFDNSKLSRVRLT